MNKKEKLEFYINAKKNIENLTKAGVTARRRIGFNDIIYFETQNIIDRFLMVNQQKALPEGIIDKELKNAHQEFVKQISVTRAGNEEIIAAKNAEMKAKEELTEQEIEQEVV